MSVQTLGEKGLKSTEEKAAAPERTVAVVTLEIRTLQRQAMQSAISYAIQIGMRLTEAKSMVRYGEWGDYVKELGYSQSTAQNLIRIFEEYGDDQLNLLGDPKSQTFGNLTYSKALALLAVPADEREEFVRENDVEEMSTRELQAAIRERDEAKCRAEVAEVARIEAQEAMAELQGNMERADKRVKDLEAELEELRSRPVEVAVQEASPEAVEAARAEGREEVAGELDKAREELKRAKEALEKAKQDGKDKLSQAEKKVIDAEDAKQRALLEWERTKAEMDKLRRELAVSGNKAVVEFGVHFAAVQEEMGKLRGCLEALEEAGDTENREKLGKAYRALMESFGAENG